ncbi:MAG: PAS domain S-box protein [Pyrinomonadaceae bacterium]|nr:PAS domain S-box protein [Blastocatellia bacterium]MCW5957871.1 PAS domain S-box protein [Pyrinomonadaceae bacterium]
MFSLNDNLLRTNGSLAQKVQSLIIGRLVAIFLLLVTSWIWYSGSTEFTLQSIPQSPLLIFIISVGLTVVYFFFLRLSKELQWQVRAQFILDALLITWLVWRTGDLTSPYITLFIVLIGVSSIFLRPRSTILMALLCIGLFLVLTLLVATGLVESLSSRQPTGKILQIVSFHSIAFLVVGLLASRLADRRSSGDELIEATKTLQNLRALHERIIESIRSGLITTDLEGNIFTFNAAASEITGYKPEEARGRSLFSMFGGILEDLDVALAEEGEVQPRFEANVTTPQGFSVRIGYSVSKLYSESNEASGYIVTFQDLTEIRSMEESIRRKDRLAAVGRVGAGLAHEIRNPLGAMRGAIQVLESSMPPNSIHTDLMGIILRESDRLNSIITNFLSYAKPRVGNFVELDLRDSIRDTVKLLRHSPDVKEEHSIAENLPETPIFISADQTQIQQVFWNLSRNAIQAMPNGGTLSITLDAKPNNRVRIIFEDTGKGMPPERVEQLFEPFATSTTGGTGLGLSIVYQIIRDHNGTITVKSIEGEGTTITIELPRDSSRTTSKPDLAEPDAPSLIEAYLNVKKEGS